MSASTRRPKAQRQPERATEVSLALKALQSEVTELRGLLDKWTRVAPGVANMHTRPETKVLR